MKYEYDISIAECAECFDSFLGDKPFDYENDAIPGVVRRNGCPQESLDMMIENFAIPYGRPILIRKVREADEGKAKEEA